MEEKEALLLVLTGIALSMAAATFILVYTG
jgi:hypothetical protein